MRNDALGVASREQRRCEAFIQGHLFDPKREGILLNRLSTVSGFMRQQKFVRVLTTIRWTLRDFEAEVCDDKKKTESFLQVV